MESPEVTAEITKKGRELVQRRECTSGKASREFGELLEAWAMITDDPWIRLLVADLRVQLCTGRWGSTAQRQRAFEEEVNRRVRNKRPSGHASLQAKVVKGTYNRLSQLLEEDARTG